MAASIVCIFWNAIKLLCDIVATSRAGKDR